MESMKKQDSSSLSSTVREIVFGMEDGMVSTLGAITGIAIGSQDLFTVILAGVVIIAVESISMGIGSYLANKTEHDIDMGRITEKRADIEKNPQSIKAALERLFIKDGWSEDLARDMSETASQNKELAMKEITYRDLQIAEDAVANPIKNGFFMYLSYIIGGIIPLFAYFILPVSKAMPLSIAITLAGLFLLGVATTKFTKEFWLKSGARILLFGTVALIVGFVVGNIASNYGV